MIYGLMYSGGVDSLVCLKLLQDQGITPYLFHISYPAIKKYFFRIKTSAKIISPNSPFYVWDADDYHAVVYGDGEYGVCLNKNTRINFGNFVDRLCIGYFSKDLGNGREHREEGHIWTGEAVKFLKKNPNIILPVSDMGKRKIDAIWKSLPKEVRINTITTSRYKNNAEWINSFED